MDRKVLLMILDGWGEGKHDWTNAIYTQGAPYIDSLRAKYPCGHLQACGEYVGLPDGQMGNSEVGHLNLGAGRGPLTTMWPGQGSSSTSWDWRQWAEYTALLRTYMNSWP